MCATSTTVFQLLSSLVGLQIGRRLGKRHHLELLKPRGRDQGAFLMPSMDVAEPQRTELALAEAFNCGLNGRSPPSQTWIPRPESIAALAGIDRLSPDYDVLEWADYVRAQKPPGGPGSSA